MDSDGQQHHGRHIDAVLTRGGRGGGRDGGQSTGGKDAHGATSASDQCGHAIVLYSQLDHAGHYSSSTNQPTLPSFPPSTILTPLHPSLLSTSTQPLFHPSTLLHFHFHFHYQLQYLHLSHRATNPAAHQRHSLYPYHVHCDFRAECVLLAPLSPSTPNPSSSRPTATSLLSSLPPSTNLTPPSPYRSSVAYPPPSARFRPLLPLTPTPSSSSSSLQRTRLFDLPDRASVSPAVRPPHLPTESTSPASQPSTSRTTPSLPRASTSTPTPTYHSYPIHSTVLQCLRPYPFPNPRAPTPANTTHMTRRSSRLSSPVPKASAAQTPHLSRCSSPLRLARGL